MALAAPGFVRAAEATLVRMARLINRDVRRPDRGVCGGRSRRALAWIS